MNPTSALPLPARTGPGPTTPPAGGVALATWQLFAAALVATAAAAWVNNEFVMTREVFHNLLGGQMEAARVDDAFRTMQRGAGWSYALLPVVLALRLAMVALLLQMMLLITGAEAPFRRLFRAALWAYPALLWASAVRLAVLVRTPAAEIDQAALAAVPGSVAAYRPDLAAPGTPLHALLALLTQWEVVWMVLLYLAVRAALPRAGRAALIGAVGGTWAIIVFFQWIATALFAGRGI